MVFITNIKSSTKVIRLCSYAAILVIASYSVGFVSVVYQWPPYETIIILKNHFSDFLVKNKTKNIVVTDEVDSIDENIEIKNNKYDFENDPIGKAFYGKVKPLASNLLGRYIAMRKFSTKDFPLNENEYNNLKNEIRAVLINSMSGSGGDGNDWVIRNPVSKFSKVQERFEKVYIDTVSTHGRNIELFKLIIKDTGDEIPIGICYPDKRPAPGIILFSGHTAEGGLRELYVDENSYQKAMARKLCEQGFVTLALEKIDSGVSTIHFQIKGERWIREDEPGGGADDELETATTVIGLGDYLIPARQLMANIAALEVLASDPLVDHNRIGAAGVSLGGWLTLQTALVNDRIKAVSNFGGMWSYLDYHYDNNDLDGFEGINDFSQLFPGIWKLGDQNRFVLTAAPLVMQIGYGKQDYPYTNYIDYFHPVVMEQYQKLGVRSNLVISNHHEGHVFPVDKVVRFFKSRL